MTIREALQQTEILQIAKKPLPVEISSAEELRRHAGSHSRIMRGGGQGKSFRLAVASNADFPVDAIRSKAPSDKNWAFLRLAQDGSGELVVSHPSLLYAYATMLVDDWGERNTADFASGHYFTSAFKWHRPLFDYLLTQTWRTARHFDPEAHIRGLARAGYTHIEVNGLASPVPIEEAVPGEFYSQFYAYCIALDQYVYSDLNKGIYPYEYLSHNLALLKKYARLGQKYGLVPGILCFEPRTVPERFFTKYPTLRGARVDHPFRSRKPRYTMTHAHPLVRQHYHQMVQKLLHTVPELSYMSIWSNDSGSGFEYTSSLYVGRNGGPYLIREWRSHDKIAKVAAKNIVDFMKIIRTAAAEINPDFRVTLRLEPFKVEHDHILEALESHLDIEIPSLLVRGYDLPYSHPKYDDVVSVAGSVHQLEMDGQEKALLEKHKKGGIEAQLIYTHGNGYNFEPLFGLPFPRLLHRKMKSMVDTGIEYAANLGGFTPPNMTPYHINQEVFRAFMLDPKFDLEAVLRQKAKQWVGDQSETLLKVWNQAEEAISWTPPMPLYSGFGFVWYRLWIRPFVPDLLAIPDVERRYYEDFMVTMPNNTNMVDLGKDVLFELVGEEAGRKFAERVDANVIPRLDKALALARETAANTALSDAVRAVFADQRDRLRALRCWLITLRSLGAWVAGVHGYLGSKDAAEKKKHRAFLDDMMDREIANTKDLLDLWNSSNVDFMAISGAGETSYIYGENIGELIPRKIELMEKYRNVEPRIDPDILWRV